MTKINTKLLYLSLSLAIITSLFFPTSILAGTITINSNGTISAPVVPSVLGKSTETTTNPQIEAIQTKMATEEQEILRLYQSSQLTREEVRARKLALVAKYKEELRVAKQPIIDQIKDQAREQKTEQIEQFTTEQKQLKIVNSADDQIKLQTKSTEGKTQVIAKEDELVFTQTKAEGEVKSKITSRNQNKYLITDGVVAKIGTPVGYDLETNEMTINTPSGVKAVSILPNEALKRAQQDSNLEVKRALTFSDITGDSQDISLVNYEDSSAYQVIGTVKKNLLGIIPISLNKTVYVSAVSGNIITTKQSGFSKLLEQLTF